VEDGNEGPFGGAREGWQGTRNRLFSGPDGGNVSVFSADTDEQRGIYSRVPNQHGLGCGRMSWSLDLAGGLLRGGPSPEKGGRRQFVPGWRDVQPLIRGPHKHANNRSNMPAESLKGLLPEGRDGDEDETASMNGVVGSRSLQRGADARETAGRRGVMRGQRHFVARNEGRAGEGDSLAKGSKSGGGASGQSGVVPDGPARSKIKNGQSPAAKIERADPTHFPPRSTKIEVPRPVNTAPGLPCLGPFVTSRAMRPPGQACAMDRSV